MNPRYSAPLIKSVALGIAIATAGVSTHAADDPRIGTYVTTATPVSYTHLTLPTSDLV